MVIDSQGRRALVLVASSAAVLLTCLLDTQVGHSARGFTPAVTFSLHDLEKALVTRHARMT